MFLLTCCVRFVNDAPSEFSNAIMKRYVNSNGIYLTLVASKDIEPKTELR